MSTRPARNGFVAMAVIVGCLTAAACDGRGSKITQGNYDRIAEGMAIQQVEEILGTGEVVDEAPKLESVARVREKHKDIKTIKWQWTTKSIVIVFAEDKVVFKSKGGF